MWRGVGGAQSSRACGEVSGVPGPAEHVGRCWGCPAKKLGVPGPAEHVERHRRCLAKELGVPGPAERVERRRGCPAAASSLKHITGCGVWSLSQGAFKLLTI